MHNQSNLLTLTAKGQPQPVKTLGSTRCPRRHPQNVASAETARHDEHRRRIGRGAIAMASATALGLIWWSAQTTDYAGLPINALGQVVGDLLMMGMALPALSGRSRQNPKHSKGTRRDSALITCLHRSVDQTNNSNQPTTPPCQRQRPLVQLRAAPTYVVLVKMRPGPPPQAEAWIPTQAQRQQLQLETTTSMMVLTPMQSQTIWVEPLRRNFRRSWPQHGYALLLATQVGEVSSLASRYSKLRTSTSE